MEANEGMWVCQEITGVNNQLIEQMYIGKERYTARSQWKGNWE